MKRIIENILIPIRALAICCLLASSICLYDRLPDDQRLFFGIIISSSIATILLTTVILYFLTLNHHEPK